MTARRAGGPAAGHGTEELLIVEAISCFVVLFVSGLFVAAAFVLVKLRGLSQRLSRVEAWMTEAALQSRVGAASPARPGPESVPVPAPAQAPAPEPQPAEPALPSPEPAAEPLPTPAPSRVEARPPAAPSGGGWEERLGARLPVWLGAIALALAAAFLVKYTVERDLLSPAVRLALGILFGIVLLIAGERLRASVARVADGLSAAGIAALYASFLAGMNLYELIPVAVGFGLMALTTAVAIGLILRQGMLVAVVGLVGGFTTPFWIETADPNPWSLFGYLLLLEAAVIVVSRRRGWPLMAALALVGGALWVSIWLPEAPQHGASEWPLLLFIALTVALVLATTRVLAPDGRWGNLGIDLGFVRGAVVAGLALTGLATVQAELGTREWVFVGLLAAAGMVLGRLQARLHDLAWIGALTPAAILGIQLFRTYPGPEEGSWRFLAIAATFAALTVLGAYACLWRSPQAGRWAALSVTAGVAYFLLAFRGGPDELPWGGLALGWAALLLLGALPVARRRTAGAPLERGLAALAAGVTVFLSLAVPLELRREWLTVAWAVEVPALVWLAGRFRLPILTRLSWIVGGFVLVRLLLNPSVLGYPIGEMPLANWLLYGYGVPAAGFALAAFLSRRQGEPLSARFFEWGTFALGVVLVALQIRHFHHGEAFGSASPLLVEAGTGTVVFLALACLLQAAARRWPLPSLVWGGPLMAVGTLVLATCLQLLALNPLTHVEPVGRLALFNTLGWAFGLPALLLLVIARLVARRLFGISSLVFAFAFLSLETRRYFRGEILTAGTAGAAEHYAYSAVWMLFAVALLVAGVWRRNRPVRLAGLIVMSLVVVKVFLFDMAHLVDLFRVASFLGLGLSLMLLAYLYSRYALRLEEPRIEARRADERQ